MRSLDSAQSERSRSQPADKFDQLTAALWDDRRFIQRMAYRMARARGLSAIDAVGAATTPQVRERLGVRLAVCELSPTEIHHRVQLARAADLVERVGALTFPPVVRACSWRRMFALAECAERVLVVAAQAREPHP